jgi:HlyD family secretion protein
MTIDAESLSDTDYRSFARIGYLAIALTFGGFGLWAANAPLDGAAIASGKIAVESDRKPVQHLEGGIIADILVHEAQAVTEGQVLFRLQSTQAKTSAETLRKQLDAGLATEARILAEQAGQGTITFPPDLLDRASGDRETAQAVADQQHQLVERRRYLESQIAIQKSKMEQTSRDIAGKSARLKALKSQAASFDTEIGRVSSLAAKGFYPRNKLLELERQRDGVDAEVAAADGEISLNRERIEEAKAQIREIEQQDRQQLAETLAQTRGRNGELRQKLTQADDVLSRIEVRAPRGGVVQEIKFHTVGAVVRPGDTLAEVIPVNDTLILSAHVAPTDINVVSAGQKAEVRFPAFASRHLPAMYGRLVSLSADAVNDEQTHQPYYAAKVVIDQGTIRPDIAKSLVPGMPADVIITTGERTVLQYLVGPLLDKLALGMRER